MNYRTKTLSALVMLSIGFGEVVINEYSASNLTGYADDYDKYEDWIEIYNTGTSDVDISGFYLSDNPNNPTKWSFPAGTIISGNRFLIIWCSGRDEINGDNYHTNFKLKQTKEEPDHIVFSTSNGDIINDVPLQKTQLEHSYGRLPNDLNNWRIFNNPTLGSVNFGSNYERYAEKPTMSLEAGYHTGAQTLEISTNEPISSIFYTTNGNRPNIASNLYSEPIFLANTQIVKALVLSNNPEVLPSFIEFNTYLK